MLLNPRSQTYDHLDPESKKLMLNTIAFSENKGVLVLGSRVLGTIGEGAMPPHQKFGNVLSSWLVQSFTA